MEIFSNGVAESISNGAESGSVVTKCFALSSVVPVGGDATGQQNVIEFLARYKEFLTLSEYNIGSKGYAIHAGLRPGAGVYKPPGAGTGKKLFH